MFEKKPNENTPVRDLEVFNCYLLLIAKSQTLLLIF